jgi:hypothetical protein
VPDARNAPCTEQKPSERARASSTKASEYFSLKNHKKYVLSSPAVTAHTGHWGSRSAERRRSSPTPSGEGLLLGDVKGQRTVFPSLGGRVAVGEARRESLRPALGWWTVQRKLPPNSPPVGVISPLTGRLGGELHRPTLPFYYSRRRTL